MLLLRITRQAAVEYFKFQMALIAARKMFGTFLMTFLVIYFKVVLQIFFRTTMSTVILKSRKDTVGGRSEDLLAQIRKFNSPQFLENSTLQGSNMSCR